MDTCHNFAKNLSIIREMRHLTFTEFAQELGIPKSTLQSAMTDGNTNFHTACHIANRLGVPLSALTGEMYSGTQMELLALIMRLFDFFSRMSQKDQEETVIHVKALLETVQK